MTTPELIIHKSSVILFDLIHDAQWRAKVVNSIASAVETSFKVDIAQGGSGTSRTNREERRRIAICLDLVERLRGDEAWSCPHLIDAMPRALRGMLDSGSFDSKAENRTWIANGG